jgi:hypothetical protein
MVVIIYNINCALFQDNQTMVRLPAEQAPVLDFKQEIRVDKINVTGLDRTKDDFILPIVKEVFQATNFGDVSIRINFSLNIMYLTKIFCVGVGEG